MNRNDVSRTTIRRATWSYLLALSLIASLSVGTHLVVDSIVARQEATAHVVNISGRQRMLSQRIAGLARELSLAAGSGPDARTLAADLTQAAGLMEISHRELADGIDAWTSQSGGNDAIATLYRKRPDGLEAQVETYLALTRAYLAVPDGARAASPQLAMLLTLARRPLLVALDGAVRQYQTDSETTIARLRWILLGLMGLMLATLTAEGLFIFRPLFRRLATTQAELLEAAQTDPLTGCMNRRHFIDSATREFERAQRHATATGLLMIDIDRFKAINDTHGHPVGDMAIRAMVAAAVETLRSSDMFGRVGGEEFALMLPETDLPNTMIVAEKLRARLAAARFEAAGTVIGLTVSIGVTVLLPGDHSLFDAIKRADDALYRAKREGRNRVVPITAPLSTAISA